ncbi:MAG: nicotinate-nucleotide adenylyltransferase [Deltaproteobacteria bacterium]|nr:nicotinate-nucleotide adenylyltransferase [Deltaproteobacteria bacterium]
MEIEKGQLGRENTLKLGILGGTFDPIHLGHLRVAEEVGEDFELQKVYLIPAAVPPHKEGKPITPFHHRLEMTRIAAEESPLLEALDLEGRRQGLSYSIDTLREFHRLYGEHLDLYFILGMDAFLEIGTWKEYGNLFHYANFLVISRPGFHSEEIGAYLSTLGMDFRPGGEKTTFIVSSGNRVIYKRATLIDISSTEIRKRVSRNKSIRFLVPEKVRKYIIQKGLFRDHGDS